MVSGTQLKTIVMKNEESIVFYLVCGGIMLIFFSSALIVAAGFIIGKAIKALAIYIATSVQLAMEKPDQDYFYREW